MDALDTRTLVAVLTAVTLVLLVAQILIWRVHRRVPGTGHWALMTTFLCLGVALLATRDVAPDLLSIVASNLFILAATLTGLQGMRRFRGRRRSRRELAVEVALFVVTAAAQSWMTFVTPSFRGRIILMSAALGFGVAWAAVVLARGAPPKTRAASYATASMFGAVSLVLALRAILFAAGASTGDSFMASTSVQTATFVIAVLCAVGWTLGLVLLGAQRVELELNDAKEVLERLAATDELTGIRNRRALFEQGEAEVGRALRYQTPLSVIVFDLDQFKRINDQHGHATGDEVLCEVVARCRDAMRAQDIFGRIGGEEFAVVVPNTPATGAVQFAERLRDGIARTPIATAAGPLAVSASFGVSGLGGASSFPALLQAADRAMYGAKSEGRDSVRVDPVDEEE